MAHRVALNWEGKMKFQAQTPGGTLSLDTSPAVGGEGNGLRPKPLMLVSLGGCTAMDVAALMRKMRVDGQVASFRVEVQGELTDEHPKHYRWVRVDYYFQGKEMNQSLLTKAVRLSVDRYCGVIYMFRQFAEFEYEIHFDETSE